MKHLRREIGRDGEEPTPLEEIDIRAKCIIRDVVESDLERLTWFGTLADFQSSIRQNYRAHLEGRMRYLVADLQGYPVGQTAVAFERPSDMPPDNGMTAYLYAVRVLGPLRSLGIGTALMTAALAAVKERGYQTIRLTVQTVNPRAIALNERMGYRTVGQVITGWSFTDSSGKAQLIKEPMFVMERSI